MPVAVRTALAAVAALVLLVVGAFGIARAVHAGEILGSIAVDGTQTDIGGLAPDAATNRLEELEQILGATPHVVAIDGIDAPFTPEELGLDIDEPAMVDLAMEQGRTGGISEQFRWWLRNFFSTTAVPLIVSLDSEAVEAKLTFWDTEIIADPAVEGGVSVEGITPVPVYPEPGREIDRNGANSILLAVSLGETQGGPTLPVTDLLPIVSRSDIDAAVTRAALWVSSPITLTAGDMSMSFTVADLANALRSETTEAGTVELSFDPESIEAALETRRGDLESPPVDARLEVDGNDVIIVPGRNGTLVDPVTTADLLASIAGSSTRSGPLPLQEGAEPAVTTTHLESLGITHLVSQFTTYHPCCQNRVTNIHLIADAVDGTIVEPGETFGLNAHVGQRTTEKGYLEDGTIVQGELVETVGGGVSQFATTFYNAVFWGGYEDVQHRPHSFYFSRYPEGIEATISWPLPELEFRNDSDAAVLIKTSYADTSITVRFYGNNDGRIVAGAQRDGRTQIEVVAEGGPDARRVSARTSDRFDFRDPTTEYRENPEVDPEEEVTVQSSAQGWRVTVTRIIERGEQNSTQTWNVRYLPRREILEVHPCRMPEATITCPTTTTTLPPDSTTTVPLETTTTQSP